MSIESLHINPGALHQQASEALVSSFADPLQVRPATCAVLSGNQPYGCGEVTTTSELLAASHFDSHWAGLIGDSIAGLLDNALKNKADEKQLDHDFRLFKQNRLKAYIERHLADRDMSIERMANAEQCSVLGWVIGFSSSTLEASL